MRVPTILSPTRITELLASQYGIADVSGATEVLGSSTGHIWKIDTDSDKSYILKEFAPTFSLEQVSHEPELVMYLLKKGFPVSTYFPNRNGAYTWTLEDRPINLQSFLSGDAPKQCEAPDWLLKDSVQLLADIQVGLSDYPALPSRMDDGWFSKRRENGRGATKIGELLRLAEELPDFSSKERIIQDLQWKLSKIEAANDIPLNPHEFTFGDTHGDFNVANILVNERKIVGVVDFTIACRLPLAWEVFRSYSLGSPECADATIDLPGLARYFGWYQEKMTLSHYDLTMVGWLSYFNIVHSGFGYQEYLVDQADNRESILDYASWLVKLAKWLEINADEMGRVLSAQR